MQRLCFSATLIVATSPPKMNLFATFHASCTFRNGSLPSVDRLDTSLLFPCRTCRNPRLNVILYIPTGREGLLLACSGSSAPPKSSQKSRVMSLFVAVFAGQAPTLQRVQTSSACLAVALVALQVALAPAPVHAGSGADFVREVTGTTPGACPAGVQTACSQDATCCPIFMSSSG